MTPQQEEPLVYDDHQQLRQDIIDENLRESEEPYLMTVNLSALEHLGINLYSNLAAVLTEAVANAWDADARTVDIRIDAKADSIVITDDGIGMTVEDMNKKYLRIGYRRREDESLPRKLTDKGRQIMGRKGLGKLSLFSIADRIEVHSAKDGQRHGLRMSVAGILESVKNHEPCYRPASLPTNDVAVASGTKIALQNIKRQRIDHAVANIRKRLARRFSIIGEQFDFQIKINGQPVTTEDRGDLPIVQFLWKFGGYELEKSTDNQVLEQEILPHRDENWPADWKLRGWIGTARQPKQLDNKGTGNLNGIVILARGRLIHANILDQVNDGKLYTKYLTGQIEANFMDQDDQPDIATSDRQRIQEDDQRYIKLAAFLRINLQQIERRWIEWRRQHEVKAAKKTSPALEEWLDILPPKFRPYAETLIAKLSALPIDDETNRKLLYRHGILAFERMRLRESTKQLVESVQDVDKLLRVLADRDSLEGALYCDIVKSRLEAIEKFQSIVDNDAKEKVIQEFLFDHLWLLDPSWERVAASETMESNLIKEGVIVKDLTQKEKLGRIDIAYRTSAGKHIIVELKRANRKMKLIELLRQGMTYVDKLEKILLGQDEKHPDIEVVFVLGSTVDEEINKIGRYKSSMIAIAPGSRIVHYDSLIRNAQKAYAEYLEKDKTMDRLDHILNRI